MLNPKETVREIEVEKIEVGRNERMERGRKIKREIGKLEKLEKVEKLERVSSSNKTR